jgi:hypothetical protein
VSTSSIGRGTPGNLTPLPLLALPRIALVVRSTLLNHSGTHAPPFPPHPLICFGGGGCGGWGCHTQDAVGNPNLANQASDCSESLANCTAFAPIFGVPNLPLDILPALLSADPTAALPAAVPLIFGHNPNDAMLFMVDTDMGVAAPDIADPDNYVWYVNASLRSKAYLAGFPNAAALALPRVLAMYPPSPGNYTHNLAMLGSLLTDVEFACASHLLAAALGRLAPAQSSFSYLFTYNATWKRACDLTFPAPYGVCHTAELSFVWGRPVYSFGKVAVPCQFTPREASFAVDVGNFVAQFGATGTPGGAWEPWGAQNGKSLVLRPPTDNSGYPMRPAERSVQCKMWRDIWATRSADLK